MKKYNLYKEKYNTYKKSECLNLFYILLYLERLVQLMYATYVFIHFAAVQRMNAKLSQVCSSQKM